MGLGHGSRLHECCLVEHYFVSVKGCPASSVHGPCTQCTPIYSYNACVHVGRDPLLLDIARACIARARLAGLPLVLDGDALFLVAREPELVLGERLAPGF